MSHAYQKSPFRASSTARCSRLTASFHPTVPRRRRFVIVALSGPAPQAARRGGCGGACRARRSYGDHRRAPVIRSLLHGPDAGVRRRHGERGTTSKVRRASGADVSRTPQEDFDTAAGNPRLRPQSVRVWTVSRTRLAHRRKSARSAISLPTLQPCRDRVRSSPWAEAVSRWRPGTRCSTSTPSPSRASSARRCASSPPRRATPTTTSCGSTARSRPAAASRRTSRCSGATAAPRIWPATCCARTSSTSAAGA